MPQNSTLSCEPEDLFFGYLCWEDFPGYNTLQESATFTAMTFRMGAIQQQWNAGSLYIGEVSWGTFIFVGIA